MFFFVEKFEQLAIYMYFVVSKCAVHIEWQEEDCQGSKLISTDSD